MNEFENNGMQNNYTAPENNDNHESSGANVNYSAAPRNNESRPNGEYHYSYRNGYSTNYNPNRNTYSPYSRNYEYHTYTAPRTDEPAPQAPKKEKKTFGLGAVCALLAACIILSAAAGVGGVFLGRTVFSEETSLTPGASTELPSQNNGASVIVVNPSTTTVSTGTYADVASAVQSTVVEISTEIVQTSSLFGQYVTGGAGSGVIISADGLILTNHHVISGATKIIARLSDGTEYEATVTGADAETDVALLKINAKNLKFASMGNSDALVVGQEVVAIGNPLGKLGGSVTNGIVSALDREVQIEGEVMNLLQTNTAINPGNSGGGLFNLAGELVGVVNAKSSGTGIEGIGFAIPINDAVSVIEELSEYGYVRGRADLGIKYLEISEITLQYYYAGYTKPGIYVIESPLNAELKKNDRIVAIDNVEISSAANLKSVLRKHEIGDKLKITIVRNGRTMTVDATCYEYVPEGMDSKIEFQTSDN